MTRKEFIKTGSKAALGLSLSGMIWQSCGGIHYATSTEDKGQLVISKTEFLEVRQKKTVERKFILVQTPSASAPIGIYKSEEGLYTAALLKCTHQGCELNPGGNIYSCPCHGSEFSMEGEVLQGPAEEHLETYIIKTDHEKIYIQLH